MSLGHLSPGTRRRLLQGQAGPLPAPPASGVSIFLSSNGSDMDAEREALHSSACPEVQTFCQKHGLMFEVVDLHWGIQSSEASAHMSPELCLEELERCQRTSLGPAFVALLGDQYGPCPLPTLIEEKEWEVLRAQLATRPSDLEVVCRRFRKDENAVPPAFLLQTPGASESRSPEEPSVSSALRAAAQDALRLGLLSQEQCSRYHRSVMAWEMERGVLGPDGEQGATVFLREVQDLQRHILDDCALWLVDRLADGCLDMDAQRLLGDLKGRLADTRPGALKAHQLPWSRDLVNPKNKAHGRYLKELGEQFVARANHQVLERLREQEAAGPEPSWLFTEIRHHLALGAQATRTFCGRQDLLALLGQWLRQNHDSPHPPVLLWGPPGVGKTALLCRLAEQMPALLGRKTVTVLRLLGASGLSAGAGGLLRGLCCQVCLAYGLPPPPAQVLAARARLVHFFHTLLHTVSGRHFESLVILLDSLDDVDGGHWGRRVLWLPTQCPPRVHLILSACSGPRGALDAARRALPGVAEWEVPPLPAGQAQELVQRLLAAARRSLSPGQQDLLWASLPECGHPGRLQLAFEEARRWASFTVPAPLAATAEEATHQLCARLEQTHGRLLVAGVLGYLAASRHGLSEAELKDILSLDDEVLQAVYRDWTPPSRELLRFPPLLWVRLRRDLGHCLAQRPVDGFTLLGIAQRQLAEVVQARYLSGPEAAKRHGVLADFFSGVWSQGTKKLITLPLVGKPLNLDRKVAAQPLWFSDTVANVRKLQELPLHLLRAGRVQELKQEVLGSMNWISCRGISGGLEALLDDFALCGPHVDCAELTLVQEALQLCHPAVELRGLDKCLLYTELLARLLYFSTSHPALVGPLCQQAQSWFRQCPHPVLVPLAGFLQPPGGPLLATLTGCHKGISAVAWSLEKQLLLVGTQDGTVAVWDTEEWQTVYVLTGHTGEVKGVEVLAQGTLAISASRDHTLRLWDLQAGREKFTIWDGGSQEPPEPQTWSLHVDGPGKVLYSVSSCKVNAWHLETAELVFCILGDAGDPWMCAAVLPAQAVLLTVSAGRVVSLWSSATGKRQGKRLLSSIMDEVPTCGVPVRKRGTMVVGFSQGALCLVSSEEDRLLDTLPAAVGLLVASEDDSLLAAGFGRSVRVFLADSQGFCRFMASDLEHEDTVGAAAFGLQNNLLVTGSQDTLIQVWSLSEQGALLAVLEGVGAPVSLLAAGGALVASASQQSSSLKVWDLSRTQQQGPCVPFPDRTGLTAVSHNGAFVYFPKIGDRNKVSIWDLAEGQEQDAVDTSNEVCCLEVAEQAQLLLAGLVSGAVLVFPLRSRQDVLCIPPPEARRAVRCVALSKDERRLAVAYDHTVLVLDVSPGEPCPVIDGPTYTFYTQLPETLARAAVLADCRVLYGMSDGSLYVYECAGARVSPLEAHAGRVTCLEVSHREQLAVSGSEESRLCLWDLQACKWRLELSYTSSFCRGVQCACFSWDDKHVFAGLKDRSVIVWSVQDGTLLAVQFVHAVVNRIIPTSNGFVAPTRHGHLIRQRFQCPAARVSQQDPLKNFKKAVWMVKCRQREELAAGEEALQDTEGPREDEAKCHRRSQVCLLL
ncbi:NACHT domain- and WD repeat-containing protein 1 isoform X1 [Sorex araneus]|uniref:NACHT domain- and WD repeat-containing protein 1 isoform X1 n=2 Tax=Sorex araneus TaxID=42254 RepID=UPI002433996E|nr:NACHT domain- and WD repeat-containing protein 1 isoform X1 [Sorex araneus]